MAKQQIADVSEAATKEKEAAVSKCIQAVQRRASKEALQQVTACLMQLHSLAISSLSTLFDTSSCSLCSCDMSHLCSHIGRTNHVPPAC